MENQYSDLFLMQHLASISHQKIYPNIQSKVEMPLWKTLQITRLWNHAREQELYLLQQQQQQQQKGDWWFNQMTTNNDDDSYLSHQLLDNYLPPSWFDDTTTASTATTETECDTTCYHQQHITHDHSASLAIDDEAEGERDSDVTANTTPNNTSNNNNSTPPTMSAITATDSPGSITTSSNTNTTIITTTSTDRASLLSHTPVESLWTQDDLVSLLAVTNQDRKRKHEEDPSTVCQTSPTSPPATRAPTSPPMLKV